MVYRIRSEQKEEGKKVSTDTDSGRQGKNRNAEKVTAEFSQAEMLTLPWNAQGYGLCRPVVCDSANDGSGFHRKDASFCKCLISSRAKYPESFRRCLTSDLSMMFRKPLR